MPNYRRAYKNGATYFFTVNLNNRKSSLLTDHIELLTGAFREVRQKYPFEVDALVVLPEHLHTVITLPPDEYDFSIRLRYIKSLFTRAIATRISVPRRSASRRELGIWQKRFWEHRVCSQQDYNNHINYCYYNPVKHGWVNNVADWKYSTFHRDVKRGLFSKDWANSSDFDGEYGE